MAAASAAAGLTEEALRACTGPVRQAAHCQVCS